MAHTRLLQSHFVFVQPQANGDGGRFSVARWSSTLDICGTASGAGPRQTLPSCIRSGRGECGDISTGRCRRAKIARSGQTAQRGRAQFEQKLRSSRIWRWCLLQRPAAQPVGFIGFSKASVRLKRSDQILQGPVIVSSRAISTRSSSRWHKSGAGSQLGGAFDQSPAPTGACRDVHHRHRQPLMTPPSLRSSGDVSLLPGRARALRRACFHPFRAPRCSAATARRHRAAGCAPPACRSRTAGSLCGLWSQVQFKCGRCRPPMTNS